MEKKDNNKLISVFLWIVLLALLFLITFFFFTVYKENTNKATNNKFIDISEKTGEIKPVIIPEKIEEQQENIIKPDVQPITSNIQNNQAKTDKFYYNQLDNYSKLIYTSLVEQKETLKSGIDIINIPISIGELLNSEQEDRIETIFTSAMNAFEYDNPDVFYIDVSKLILCYERDSIGNYKIYLKNSDDNINYFVDGINTRKDVYNLAAQIDLVVQEINENTEKLNLDTDYKKILYVHNWILDNVKYDETMSRSNRNNIYGALVEKDVVCSGYAKTFKYLMDKLNINCIIIQGKATQSDKTEYHAWNYVELEEKWYGIDCTWDDPIIIGEDPNKNREPDYTYFLKGQNIFKNSHSQFESFYGTDIEIEYPTMQVEDYTVSSF